MSKLCYICKSDISNLSFPPHNPTWQEELLLISFMLLRYQNSFLILTYIELTEEWKCLLDTIHKMENET